jgi:hypothetical protein
VPRLSKEQRDKIEGEASKLYDELNPDQMMVVRVSKAECIKRARKKLGL